MRNVLNALSVLIKHIVLNVSNYLLVLGIAFILYFINFKYGTETFILSVGVVSVLTSLVLEINKNSKKKQKYY